MTKTDHLVALQLAQQAASNRVRSPIQDASLKTGISFSYLMAQAGNESAFETQVDNHASSAAGLFQFTKGTWLSLLKRHGPAHGLDDLASHIERTKRGEYVVDDPQMRQQILELRRDPGVSALMAGEYAKDNKAWLEKTLHRPVGSTELYMAHFLGPGGAAKVLKAQAEEPDRPAAELLPQAAQKNPTVFYDSGHSPLSVAVVYDRIHQAIERPMRQYAALDTNRQSTALDGPAPSATRPVHRPHAHKPQPIPPVETQLAAALGPEPWQVTPATYQPTMPSSLLSPPASASPSPSPSAPLSPLPSPGAVTLAYTDSTQSADQILSPMPPAPGLPSALEPKSPVGQLLRNLFG